ncbi:MAG: hypothetical protein WC741_01550 [Patescibacteria group bacterium]
MKRLLITITYGIVLFAFFLYSYVLIDPNITFFNSPVWSRFLEAVLQIGYYQRRLSWEIYLVLISCLTFFHLYFINQYKKYDPMKIGLMIAAILCLSYPFISHDFLKYMFDAKILTQYHQNPYLMRPIDFSYDPWLRFLQWIEQPFRYGPVFFAIIIIPSFFAAGKFLLSFIFLKMTFVCFYIAAVFVLRKMNKKWAFIFATHPLLLVDGLINGHNDLISVSFLIFGIYFLSRKKILPRVFFILSIGIKYLSLPVIFITKNRNSIFNKLIFFSLLILPYLLLNQFFGNKFGAEIQTWYFIILLGFIPYFEGIINKLLITFIGLLLSCYPYIYLGKWEQINGFAIKHIIILSFSFLNLILFFVIPSWRRELKEEMKLSF